MNRYEVFPYNTAEYDFVTPISNLMGVKNLEDLNERHVSLFQVGKDSSTSFHQKFYDEYRSGWPEMVDLYEGFIQAVSSIASGFFSGPFPDFLWGEPFLYQKFPTFRVHLPGNVAVGAFHNDAEFGHPAGEINYIIPLTNSDDTASVWVESEPGRKDFEPMKLRVGELIEFDGNRLTHGNKVNETGYTRVSMDFRILPFHLYQETAFKSMTLKTKFKEGDYYKKFEFPLE